MMRTGEGEMAQDPFDGLDDAMFERLSAYVDGALASDERAALEAEMAERPQLGEAAAALSALNADLVAAFPLGEALQSAGTARAVGADGERNGERAGLSDPASAALTPANSNRPARGAARPLWRRALSAKAALPLAAAAALAIGVSIGDWRLTSPIERVQIAAGPIDAAAALAGILEGAPMGASASVEGGDVVVLSTFLTAENAPCREFELLPTAGDLSFGVACRQQGGGWEIAFAATADRAEAPSGAITPAGGPGVDAMEALLDRLGAGPALTAAEEAALISANWRAAAQ